jgi:hypothetical protein
MDVEGEIELRLLSICDFIVSHFEKDNSISRFLKYRNTFVPLKRTISFSSLT